MKLSSPALSKISEILGSLTLYVNLVMALLLIWGVLTLVTDDPPTAVSEEASHTTYTMWLLWQILAPPAIWTGQLMRWKWLRKEIRKLRVDINFDALEWWLRWAGDAALCAMISTFILALHRQGSDEVNTVYLFFFMAGMGLVTFGLATRDLIEALRASVGRDQ